MSPSIRIKMLSISSIGSAAGSSSRGAGDTKRHQKSEKQREDDLACNATVTSSTLQQKSAGVTGSSESVASSSMKRDRNDTGVDPIERFQPVNERSLKTQFDCLTKRQRGCVEMIRQLWETDNRPLTSMDYLRIARFSNFNFRFCRKYLKKFDKRYLSLNVDFLKAQLKTHTLYPLPGLRSIDGLDMFYMRPSHYFPELTPTQVIIDNLAYVMLTMTEKESAQVNGIGFVACMNNWTLDNFSVDYCLQFMLMLQGRVPARVGLFLIVNPPMWFDSIWKIMKTMLHREFQKKVKMVKESQLSKYLENGYENYLPCDMKVGKANAPHLVDDFISYRHHVERNSKKKCTS